MAAEVHRGAAQNQRGYDPYTGNNLGLVTIGRDHVSQALLVPSYRPLIRRPGRIVWDEFPVSSSIGR